MSVGAGRVSSDLHRQVVDWVTHDPDPSTRAELTALLEAAGQDPQALDALADRFAGPLTFGTAGLRGEVAAGPHRMNRAVVIRAAAGLAAYLQRHGGTSVVVGFDARHRSHEFAQDTCAVMTAAGIEAMVLPGPLPTPVLAFAIRHLGASAGVMVTASHNPPQDNGYKVYLGDGAQIVSPTDAEIAAAIDAQPWADEVPRAEDGWRTLDDALLEAYLERVAALVAQDSPRDLRVVYTPLHGVGRDVVLAAFAAAGFSPPLIVQAQGDPDPDFPTVAFPNPEEPGAMDAAMSEAAATGADLVLANDPDADRCAAAVTTREGSWRMLTGDEVGAILADHLLARGRRGTLACSVVSSSLLAELAGHAGVPFAETLTGFKWISRAPGLTFGYEEALGYCCDPEAVRDKDGVSAALLLAEAAALRKSAGQTLLDALDDIAGRHGSHATAQVSLRVADLGEITDLMGRLRAAPPHSLGGMSVDRVEDLLGGGDLPPTDAVRLWLSTPAERRDGVRARVIVRPSGTEPKLKAYLQVVADHASRAESMLAALRADVATLLGVAA